MCLCVVTQRERERERERERTKRGGVAFSLHGMTQIRTQPDENSAYAHLHFQETETSLGHSFPWRFSDADDAAAPGAKGQLVLAVWVCPVCTCLKGHTPQLASGSGHSLRGQHGFALEDRSSKALSGKTFRALCVTTD